MACCCAVKRRILWAARDEQLMRWAEQNCMISTRCRRVHDTQSTKTHQSFFLCSLHLSWSVFLVHSVFIYFIIKSILHICFVLCWAAVFTNFLFVNAASFFFTVLAAASENSRLWHTGLLVCRFIIKFSHKHMHVNVHACTNTHSHITCAGVFGPGWDQKQSLNPCLALSVTALILSYTIDFSCSLYISPQNDWVNSHTWHEPLKSSTCFWIHLCLSVLGIHHLNT